jgi:hypothetical protein
MTVEVAFKMQMHVLTYRDVSDTHTRDGVYEIVQHDKVTRIPLDVIHVATEIN